MVNKIQEFDDNGFIILKDILPIETVIEIKKRVSILATFEKDTGNAHFYDPGYGRNYTAQRIWNLIDKDDIFLKIIGNKVIHSYLEKIFERQTTHQTYYLSSFQAHIVGPGSAPQKLHVDTPIPEEFPRWILKANTIWVIDEFTTNNGATEVLPGSHKLLTKPSATHAHVPGLIKITAKPGSVILTHGTLWHRSSANHSDQRRTSLLGSFAASFCKEIANEEDYSKVLSKKTRSRIEDLEYKFMDLKHGIKPGAI